jgi:hypothetical protein
MKIVNRGYLKVKAKQPFIDWVNQIDEEFFIDEESEANIYLVEEDFFEVDPIIKANFKKIFLNELDGVADDDSTYPEIKLENFLEWFNVEAGTMVFDCEKGSLQGD